jgi:hypothetical protein
MAKDFTEEKNQCWAGTQKIRVPRSGSSSGYSELNQNQTQPQESNKNRNRG